MLSRKNSSCSTRTKPYHLHLRLWSFRWQCRRLFNIIKMALLGKKRKVISVLLALVRNERPYSSQFALLILLYTTIDQVANHSDMSENTCTSAILFFIISSRDAVTSSVITEAGLTLCSKSRSTSRALFLGLLEAVTYKMNSFDY